MMAEDWFDSMTEAQKRAHITIECIRIRNDRRKLREAAIAAERERGGHPPGYASGISPREQPVRTHTATPSD